MFDVPVLAGVDLRALPWAERRERLQLLAQALDGPLVLSPMVEPCIELARQMADGRIEGLVIKDKRSTYRGRLACRLVQGQGPFVVRARGLAVDR